MKNLRTLIEEAQHKMCIYKSPDVDEAQSAINELLIASGQPGIMHDRLDNLEEYKNQLRISTSWSSRGCSQHGDYSLPIFILDAEDPIKAAKAWGIQEKINEYESKIKEIKSNLNWYQEKINALKIEQEQS